MKVLDLNGIGHSDRIDDVWVVSSVCAESTVSTVKLAIAKQKSGEIILIVTVTNMELDILANMHDVMEMNVRSFVVSDYRVLQTLIDYSRSLLLNGKAADFLGIPQQLKTSDELKVASVSNVGLIDTFR